jgi:hypothetical protein
MEASHTKTVEWQAADEIERLRFDLQGIHSCHNDCTRDGCVNRRLREKLRVAEEVLTNLMRVCPAEIECHNMHHAPKHRHEYDETCPVVVAYGEALIKASEALAKIREE